MIAGAGFGLRFGLGAASIVAVGWELYSQGGRHQRRTHHGDEENFGTADIEEEDFGAIESSDFKIAHQEAQADHGGGFDTEWKVQK